MTEQQDTIEEGAGAAPSPRGYAEALRGDVHSVSVWTKRDEQEGERAFTLVLGSEGEPRTIAFGLVAKVISMAWKPCGDGKLDAFAKGFAPALVLLVDDVADAFIVPRISHTGQVVFTAHDGAPRFDDDGEPAFGSSSGTFATLDEAKSYAEAEAAHKRSRETMLDEYGVDWRGLLDD